MTREEMFNSMILNPGVEERAKVKTDRLLSNKTQYQVIASIPWQFVAVVHEMECSQDFTKYLGNGQSLRKVTTIVPIGRGPFDTFKAGCIDALELSGADKVTDWSIGNMLYILEGYNGYGYEKYHNMPSPYLWAGSNFYTKGKYSSDGHFDPEMVSQQIGVAILLKQLI